MRNPSIRLAVGILFMGGVACAAERVQPSRDSAAARDAAPDPIAAFHAQHGRTWELARLGGQPLPPSRPDARPHQRGRHPGPGSRPTIRFTDEPVADAMHATPMPRVGGWSFCNGYGMAYVLGPGDSLRFSGFTSTLVGCDSADSLETRFFRGLSTTRRFALDSATLVLVAADGSRLTFVPAAQP